jgi:hypothetical protein
MRVSRFWMIVLSFAFATGLCACGGGTSVKTEQATYATTLGQELKDLEDAYKKGIITQQQYEDAKDKLIKQRTGTK